MNYSAKSALPPFTPTPEMIAAAENVFLAITIENATRPIVETYQKKILGEREWLADPAMADQPGVPERITDPKYAWLVGEKEFARYRMRCNEERSAANLPAKTDDHCPLLVAENITRVAKNALIDTMTSITKIDSSDAATMATVDYDDFVDTTLRLLAPFAKNILATPQAA